MRRSLPFARRRKHADVPHHRQARRQRRARCAEQQTPAFELDSSRAANSPSLARRGRRRRPTPLPHNDFAIRRRGRLALCLLRPRLLLRLLLFVRLHPRDPGRANDPSARGRFSPLCQGTSDQPQSSLAIAHLLQLRLAVAHSTRLPVPPRSLDHLCRPRRARRLAQHLHDRHPAAPECRSPTALDP